MTEVLRGSGIGQVVSKKEGRARLDAITVEDSSTDWAVSEIVDAEELAHRLNAWIAGHTHKAETDEVFEGCRLLGRQKGYPGELWPAGRFRFAKAKIPIRKA
jgi:hypothetical protein|tara:strand:+ start:6487 stop:6792 length:306 start_codon:yes stop_codon:yes gene_type:complete